ncbi:MAG TPA: type II secretion system F family protein [Candidatus Paceibacterota bacterium]
MVLFQFTAVRQGGDVWNGVREAETKHELVEVLRSEGSTALVVEEQGKGSSEPLSNRLSHVLNFKISLFSGAPSIEKILFARNLAAMITAGLPLSRALAVLEKQTRNARMKDVIIGLEESVRQGRLLHDAFADFPKVFSPMFVAMARAGEESGALADSLRTVALQMERSHALTKKVRGAMIYPAIVTIVMIAIGVLMLIYVVPTLSDTFAALGSDLPLPTKIILSISNFLINDAVLIVSVAAVLVGGLVAALRTRVGKRAVDRFVLVLPIVGSIVARMNAARTARTLSSLLSSGVSALTALEITHDVVQNTRFREVIEEAHHLVEKGRPLSEAFVEAENIYPVMFAEMAAVGEETGDASGMLVRVADFYEDEVEQETKDLSTIVEPILMVVIGGCVGFFAIAMIMPIYSLSNSM